MSSSIHTSDDIDIDNSSNAIEENKIIKSDINLLNKKLLNIIYIDTNLDYNNPMEPKSQSDNKSDKSINSSYFDTHEQINEVKINIYYILSLDCRLVNDSNSKYFTFLKNGNILTTYRLVIQNFHLKEKKLIYEDKEYKFIPTDITTTEFNFFHNGKNIKYYNSKKQYKMKSDNKPLLSLTEFVQKLENTEIGNIITQSEPTDKKDEDEDKSNKKSTEDKAKSRSSKESNLSHMTKSDDSEKETKGERFYEINKENDYTRFFFKKYIKEIDGIYNMHKSIKLNIMKTITLEEGLKNLKNSYNNNNDLKCGIIYKNFVGDIIDEKEPIIIEVKKGFRLINLLNQIKQNSKVFHNLSCLDKVILPKYAIGIICTDYHEDYKEQIKTLNDPYKNDPNNTEYTLLNHISEVIKKNKFNVVIGVFKTPKILEYPIDIEDYKIGGKKLIKRVDLKYMKEATGINKTDEQLADIENRFKNKYRSLRYIGTVTIKEHKEKLEEKDKKLEEKDKLIESQRNLIINIQDEINKLEEMKKREGSEKELFETIKKQLNEFKK